MPNVKALKSFTVCVCKPGTTRPQYATALTVASTKEEAVKRVIKLYSDDDPLLLKRTLVALDAYSELSTTILEAECWENVDEAVAAFARIEAGHILRRPERTKVRTPRDTVASVRKGTVKRSKAEVAETVQKLNRIPLKELASALAAEMHAKVNEGSRPAFVPVANKHRKAAVAKRVAKPKAETKVKTKAKATKKTKAQLARKG